MILVSACLAGEPVRYDAKVVLLHWFNVCWHKVWPKVFVPNAWADYLPLALLPKFRAVRVRMFWLVAHE